jgi:hypothetical protein
VTERIKASLAKSTKISTSKKRSREEAYDAGQSSSSSCSGPPNSEKEWKKAKLKIEDILTLVNSGFLRKKEMDLRRASTRDMYPMEKNPDEIPMFARFMERGLALLAGDFFKAILQYYGIEYMTLNLNRIFHISFFIHFCEAFVGIKLHWILFRKFFRLKLQPSADDPRVVGGAGVQMREDVVGQYVSYKFIDSNQD